MNRFTTLEVALGWFSGFKNKPIDAHRSFLLEQINDCRQLFYSFYEDVPLFEDDQECFCVQQFAQDCGSCENTFLGVTLPDYMISVAAMWTSDAPIKLYGKWREYKTGIMPSDRCRLENYTQATRAPTEREIYPLGSACRLAFVSESEADDGKTAIIRYFDVAGQVKEDEIALEAGVKKTTSSSAIGVPDRGIVLPSTLTGSVALVQADGAGEARALSSYAPHETVPSYTRTKVTGVCEGDSVLIRAARRFTPLYFDADVVETDNRLAWQNAALWLENNRSSNPESISKANYHAQACKDLLVGDKSREINKTTVRKVQHTTYRPRVSGLRSKRFSRVYRRL